MNTPTKDDLLQAAHLCHVAAVREHQAARTAMTALTVAITSPLATLTDWVRPYNRLKYHQQREREYRAEAVRMTFRASRTTNTIPL